MAAPPVSIELRADLKAHRRPSARARILRPLAERVARGWPRRVALDDFYDWMELGIRDREQHFLDYEHTKREPGRGTRTESEKKIRSAQRRIDRYIQAHLRAQVLGKEDTREEGFICLANEHILRTLQRVEKAFGSHCGGERASGESAFLEGFFKAVDRAEIRSDLTRFIDASATYDLRRGHP